MITLRSALSRRAALGGAALALTGIGWACAPSELERSRKFEAWVNAIRTVPDAVPMTNSTILDFPTDEMQRKQVAITRDGVFRQFAVVMPYQQDGIVLVAGNPAIPTFNVHRTGTHLRRVSSGRSIGGQASRWSGPECDADFHAQVDFWVALPIPK